MAASSHDLCDRAYYITEVVFAVGNSYAASRGVTVRINGEETQNYDSQHNAAIIPL